MMQNRQQEQAPFFLLLMPWGRVGSNLLVNILAQHLKPVGGKIYNEPTTGIQSKWKEHGPDRIAEEQRLWFEEFSREAMSGPRGANISMSSLVDLDWFKNEITLNRPALVYLDRKNVLKTAVSVIKAKMYAAFSKEYYGKETWALKSGMRRLDSIHVDVQEVKSLIQKIESHRSQLSKLREEHEGLSIYYEDINFDLHAVILELLSFLGIPLIEFRVDMQKNTSDSLEDEIRNFGELESALEEPYLSQLHSSF